MGGLRMSDSNRVFTGNLPLSVDALSRHPNSAADVRQWNFGLTTKYLGMFAGCIWAISGNATLKESTVTLES